MSATLTGNAQETVAHLALLKKGDSATVTGLAEAVGDEQLAIKVRLLELGFAAGEKIRVVAESFPRRDPMAVRVGNTTFALRRAEAAMIQISTDSPRV
jgi:ferrous iron transport protein A